MSTTYSAVPGASWANASVKRPCWARQLLHQMAMLSMNSGLPASSAIVNVSPVSTSVSGALAQGFDASAAAAGLTAGLAAGSIEAAAASEGVGLAVSGAIDAASDGAIVSGAIDAGRARWRREPSSGRPIRHRPPGPWPRQREDAEADRDRSCHRLRFLVVVVCVGHCACRS